MIKLYPLLFSQTRVLVTHGLSFLPQADLILVMVDGEITETGSYAELRGRQGAFAEFLRTYANAEQDEEAEGTGGESRIPITGVKAASVAHRNVAEPSTGQITQIS